MAYRVSEILPEILIMENAIRSNKLNYFLSITDAVPGCGSWNFSL